MRFLPFPKLAAIALALAGSAIAPVSHAATATGSLLVSATVLSTCTVSATPVAFGNYTTAQVDATGTITVTCTLDVSTYNIALGTGTGSGATTAARKLTSAATNTLNYALYRDSGHTLNWGVVPGTDTVASTANTGGSGAVKTFTAYGRLPANQTSAADNYFDTVVITVNF